jgi:hypothetical protein
MQPTQNAAHTKCTHLAAPDTKVGGRQGGGQGQEVGVKQGEVEDGGVGPRGVLLVVQVPVEVEGHILWIHGVHHRVGCDRDGDVRRGAAAHDNNQAHETCKHDTSPNLPGYLVGTKVYNSTLPGPETKWCVGLSFGGLLPALLAVFRLS